MADDNDVQRIYESLDTLNKRVDGLENKGLGARIKKLEEGQTLILEFCFSLEPLIKAFKSFRSINIFEND
jgi:hypothetical protein